jgi:hypothetical protein
MSTHTPERTFSARPLPGRRAGVDEFGIPVQHAGSQNSHQSRHTAVVAEPAAQVPPEPQVQQRVAEHAQPVDAPEERAPAWKGDCVPVQFRLPSDLVTSLRLLAYQQGSTMSELVCDALTEGTPIPKAWIQTKHRAG